MGLLTLFGKFFSSSKQPEIVPELEDDELFLPKDATVLIVDDSKTHVAACKKWLSDDGYNTLTAFDGREGIHSAKKGQPDLILMDIVMPNVNGFQATRYLKRQADTKHIPIILISGEEQSSGKIWAKKLGASSFLVKPLKKQTLLKVTAKVLDHYTNLSNQTARIDSE